MTTCVYEHVQTGKLRWLAVVFIAIVSSGCKFRIGADDVDGLTLALKSR